MAVAGAKVLEVVVREEVVEAVEVVERADVHKEVMAANSRTHSRTGQPSDEFWLWRMGESGHVEVQLARPR